jgi:hypothetical protein
MNRLVLTEKEFRERTRKIFNEEQLKITEEKWNSLTKVDKIFVVEFLKELYPEKGSLLNEDKWYNTLGDIAGIFDPTGIIDVVNGISYWRQDDKLFAILSWISAIPLLGDAIAKPVVGIVKAGGTGAKALKGAIVSNDAVKLAKTAKEMGGPIAKLVETSPMWASKLIAALRGSIGKVPFLGTRFVGLVEEFLQLFVKGSKGMEGSAKLLGKLEAKGLSQVEKQALLNQIAKESKFRGFRDYKNINPTFFSRIAGGVPRLWGNRATRSLMRRTKWYLGLLDSIGLGNFVGPEELEKQVPNLEQKVAEYSKTQKSQDLWNEEFGNVKDGETPVKPVTAVAPEKPMSTSGADPIGSLINSLLGGAIKSMI